jgi:hypothetical protein
MRETVHTRLPHGGRDNQERAQGDRQGIQFYDAHRQFREKKTSNMQSPERLYGAYAASLAAGIFSPSDGER